MSRLISYAEVQAHAGVDSCWVILYNSVYDVTSFMHHHPGGLASILKLAGQDATEEYDPIHPQGTLEESLPPEAKLGVVDPDSLPKTVAGLQVSSQRSDTMQAQDAVSSPQRLLNLDDVEQAAVQKLSKKALAYYRSATDDSFSKSLNNAVYQSILFRPKVFVDVSRCDLTTTFLGYTLAVPFYVSPAAMARLAHPDGEWGIAQACKSFQAMHLISNYASMQPEQIVKDAGPDQVFGFQLYAQNDRKKSEDILARVDKLDAIKFVCLTLDVPVPGKREEDERHKHAAEIEAGLGGAVAATNSVTGSLAGANDMSLTWETTLPWLRAHTKKPIVLKGIQRYEDAILAAQHSDIVKGIVLSNHGGRALDTAPPAIHTLLEIHKYCPEVLSRVEVLVDGGIRRGTDIIKALALGAKAVGLGRSPLYGLGVAGQPGVERVFEILRDEATTAMRMLGCGKIADLGPQCINTSAIAGVLYQPPMMANIMDRLKSRL